MKNLSLKLWSIFIAAALAYFVHGQSNNSVLSLNIPVELRNLPETKVVLLPNAAQAQVSLRGPSYLLSDITRNPLSFKVQVPEEVGNTFRVQLNVAMLNLSPSVDVENIEPTEVEFVLDEIVEKQVRIEVPRIGALPDGYRVVNLSVEPEFVTARGPKTEIDSYRTINAKAIDLRHHTQSTEIEISIKSPGRYTTFSPDKAKVTLDVTPLKREKKFKKIPITIEKNPPGFAGNYELSHSSVELEISAPVHQLKATTKDSVVASILLDNKFFLGDTISKEIPVQIKLPEGVKLVKVTPKTITATKK